ncbi:hypothetical protein OSB04_003907 [Centaurea solstitialis]|uniref:CASP-like protein n=1 Tax=Centaurea solstitialis TaxID=347529 RepID=A0AA38U692_9ASTR|nr:hypothetical protein OSB04_003907 [Centaurea solstitialis]
MMILGENVSNLKVIDSSLRLMVIPISVASMWLTLTNQEDNPMYGKLEFSNIKGLKLLISISAISAGYSLVAVISSWIKNLMNKAWIFLVCDQVVAYMMVACGGSIGEIVYLAYNGNPKSFWKLVGDGKGTSFWEESWVEAGKLKDTFRRLFLLESSRGATIAERGEIVDGVWRWSWKWRREPRGRELGELEGLMKALEGFSPKINVEDRDFWKLDPKGEFSVKRLRKEFVGAGERGVTLDRRTLWLKAIPKKVCIFLWRARLGRLPVRVELAKRGIDIPSVLCPRCEKGEESVEHALVGCEKVIPLWKRIGRWWKINIGSSITIEEVINLGNQEGVNSKGGRRWMAMTWCVMYLIWVNRNKIVFQNSKVSMEESLFSFQLKAFEWVNLRDIDLAVDWKTWMTDPLNGS